MLPQTINKQIESIEEDFLCSICDDYEIASDISVEEKIAALKNVINNDWNVLSDAEKLAALEEDVVDLIEEQEEEIAPAANKRRETVIISRSPLNNMMHKSIAASSPEDDYVEEVAKWPKLENLLSSIINTTVTNRIAKSKSGRIPLGKKVGTGIAKIRLEHVNYNVNIGNFKLAYNNKDSLVLSTALSGKATLIYRHKKLFGGYGRDRDKNLHIKGALSVIVKFTDNAGVLEPDVEIVTNLTDAYFRIWAKVSIRGLIMSRLNPELDKLEKNLEAQLKELMYPASVA
jgi:hypothetical protein